jgi:hypothetical protein
VCVCAGQMVQLRVAMWEVRIAMALVMLRRKMGKSCPTRGAVG